MEFFVSYNMLDWFNQKSEKSSGNYRHILSQRIYLYLLHYKSGRIHKDNLKELVVFFGSSKQNILKALNTLVKWGIVITDTEKKSEGGYYRALGSAKFDSELYYKPASYLYRFTENDLLDSKRFKNLIFKFISQNTANIYGTKTSNGEKVKFDKVNKKPYVLGKYAENAEDKTSESEDHKKPLGEYKRRIRIYNPTVDAVYQKQSLSYLGNANQRSSRTISRKLNKLELSENVFNETIDLKVKHGKFRTLSSLGFEHLKMKKEKLHECLFYTEFKSTSEDWVEKELNHFKEGHPILGEHSFVASKDGNFFAASNPSAIFTYSNIDKTSKFNRLIKFGIKF